MVVIPNLVLRSWREVKHGLVISNSIIRKGLLLVIAKEVQVLLVMGF